MLNRFAKRLKSELPHWVDQGWVTPAGAQSIEEHVADRSGGDGFLVRALAILGVLLLGSGVFTFFAANWSELAKLTKLGLLLGGLWVCYGTAGRLLARGEYQKTAHALLLLGVLLFGANVMLVAQIYHIDAHYPNGVLLWAIGGLVTAWLLPSQSALVAAIALLILWTGMESQGFGQVHLWFLPLWAVALIRLEAMQWRFAFHVAMVALMIWSAFTLLTIGDHAPWENGLHLYLVEAFTFAYLALFLTGMLMETTARLRAGASTVRRYALLALLICLYALTFPRLHQGLVGWEWVMSSIYGSAEGIYFLVVVVVLIALVLLLSLWHRRRTLSSARPPHLLWGQVLLGSMVLLMIASLFLGGRFGSLVAIAYNLFYFAGLVWLVAVGRVERDQFLINIGFGFFALVLLSRYFDTFWTQMNRSFFFMVGGVILLAGGFFLERQRRRLIAPSDESHPGGVS